MSWKQKRIQELKKKKKTFKKPKKRVKLRMKKWKKITKPEKIFQKYLNFSTDHETT